MKPSALDALGRGDLAGARELKLACGLTAFPDEIFGLADTLEVLDLSGNALTDLPKDLGRLTKLQTLFCSGNRFERLPPSLGDCPALCQVGFRATCMVEAPAEALPPGLRWLTLTDNRLTRLPDALGRRPALQKLMLAGNHLIDLPSSLQGARRLELLRLSANRFDALPPWLTDLPHLAWLSWAGNPFDRAAPGPTPPGVRWDRLRIDGLLGEGASGQVYRARRPRSCQDVSRGDPGLEPDEAGAFEPVALKLFKGEMTSDGLPEREMAACLAAGAHPNLIAALGRIVDHPQRRQGLLMPLLPASWRVLAGPPSRASCTRDVYDPSLKLELATALRIARAIARGAGHLHGRGLLHGDLYAHNVLWDGQFGDAVLTDFGAASFLPVEAAAPFTRLEVRAFGLLLGELLDACTASPDELVVWRDLEQVCTQPDPAGRPQLADVLAALEAYGAPRSTPG